MNHDNVEKLADDIALLLTKYDLPAESFDLTIQLVTDAHNAPVMTELIRNGNAFQTDHYRITLHIQR